jgi:uncharacterized MAPEG superfamily protein
MRPELYTLAFLSILFLLAFLPASIGKKRAFGWQWLAGNRRPLTDKSLEPWADRCERAHNNLKDNFPGFVVAILLLHQLQKFDDVTAALSLIYVAGRIGHFVAYGIGNPLLRGTFYFVGLFSNLALLIKVIS